MTTWPEGFDRAKAEAFVLNFFPDCPVSEKSDMWLLGHVECALAETTKQQLNTTIGPSNIPTPIPVRDRNGQPTGAVRYSPTEEFKITLQRVKFLQDKARDEGRAEVASELARTKAELDGSRREVSRLRSELDKMTEHARELRRQVDPDREARRVASAVAEAVATRDVEIKRVRGELAEALSMIEQLRADKKRLKAAGRK